LGKFLAPRKKMMSRGCSSSASISGILRRSSSEVEGFNGGGEDEATPWLGARERVEFE
jgi:hypothetical protein